MCDVARALVLLLPLLSGCAPGAENPGTGGAPTLLVADQQGRAVLSVDGATGDVLDVVVDEAGLEPGAAPRGFRPSALGLLDGDLLVANFESGEVLRLDPRDGAWLQTLHENDPGGVPLEEPAAMVVGADHVAVLGNDTRNLVLLDPGGGALAELGGGDSPSIRDGHGLAALPDGELVVGTGSDAEGGLLQRWDPTTGQRRAVLLDDPAVTEVTGLAVGPDGLLYVADWWGRTVHAVDPDDGTVLAELLGPDVLDDPVTLGFSAAGDLYVLQRSSIVRRSPLGRVAVLPVDELAFGRGLLVLP